MTTPQEKDLEQFLLNENNSNPSEVKTEPKTTTTTTTQRTTNFDPQIQRRQIQAHVSQLGAGIRFSNTSTLHLAKLALYLVQSRGENRSKLDSVLANVHSQAEPAELLTKFSETFGLEFVTTIQKLMYQQQQQISIAPAGSTPYHARPGMHPQQRIHPNPAALAYHRQIYARSAAAQRPTQGSPLLSSSIVAPRPIGTPTPLQTTFHNTGGGRAPVNKEQLEQVIRDIATNHGLVLGPQLLEFLEEAVNIRIRGMLERLIDISRTRRSPSASTEANPVRVTNKPFQTYVALEEAAIMTDHESKLTLEREHHGAPMATKQTTQKMKDDTPKSKRRSNSDSDDDYTPPTRGRGKGGRGRGGGGGARRGRKPKKKANNQFESHVNCAIKVDSQGNPIEEDKYVNFQDLLNFLDEQPQHFAQLKTIFGTGAYHSEQYVFTNARLTSDFHC
mmetsp:Transcript_3310/g.4866  ORF Transcript_3310/g.4866 Transcript_3310/m.4866 type:complete len:446 (-) Transcript_3310:40-1377(-)